MKNSFFLYISMMTIDLAVAQNVGIGTTTPTATLDIIGSIKVTDGTQGVGKVLTSDALGRGSWQPSSPGNPPPSNPIGDYPVVWIGCNPWMTKNLDVSTYSNGDPIPKVTDAITWASLASGAYCYFNNDSTTYAAAYGKLYNWYAVNDPRGLAPTGWHIPSEFEWTYLVTSLGGNASAGGPMKEIGTTYWNPPNLGATNLCNFAALPGGYRDVAGAFSGVGDFGNYWSSTKGESNIAWSRNLNYNDTEIIGAGTDLHFGYSVRCIRN